uniref:Uncharacterized protein n=1 Tax=Rhizophora mucronata TaxID=61149 RepID=A0A2P2QIT5_RHIMU
MFFKMVPYLHFQGTLLRSLYNNYPTVAPICSGTSANRPTKIAIKH